MGLIAAGVAVPVAVAIISALIAAAALIYWRRRRAGAPQIAPVATVSEPMHNLTISPLYESRTKTHTNELYSGDDGAATMRAAASAPAQNKDDVLRNNNMSWDLL